jgi:probable HAF family extracellular repeat protein
MILTVLEHYARWQVQGIQKLSGQLLGYSDTTHNAAVHAFYYKSGSTGMTDLNSSMASITFPRLPHPFSPI